MIGTAETLLGQVSAVPAYARPSHNLGTHEDLFLYEYGRYLLHKRLVAEGLLSPYANPFYPPTDMTHRETESKIEQTEIVKKDIDKNTIASTLNKKADNIKLKEETKTTKKQNNENEIKVPNEIEWKQGDQKTATNTPTTKFNECDSSERKAKQAVLSKNIVENEDRGKIKTKQEEMKQNKKTTEKNDTSSASNRKGIKTEEKKTYDVNKMSLEEVESFLKEQIDVVENEEEISGKSICQESNQNGITEDDKSNDETEYSDETNSSNGTVDSQGLTKRECEVFDITSIESDEETTSNCTTDEESTGDLKVPETSENDNKTSTSNVEIERILYQNELMIVRLEQAENNEDILRKENERLQASVSNEERLRKENEKLLHEIKENDSQNKHKIRSLEKALKMKTELLIAALKEKG